MISQSGWFSKAFAGAVGTFLVAELLFKKVGSNRHSQNGQICHEGLCNILNMKKKNFQTFEIYI